MENNNEEKKEFVLEVPEVWSDYVGEKKELTDVPKIVDNTDQNSGKIKKLSNLKPPFPKGVSGNPKGRPKGTVEFWTKLESVFDVWKKKQENSKYDLTDVEDFLLESVMKTIKGGNYVAMKDLIERKYGKVKEEIHQEVDVRSIEIVIQKQI